MAESTQESSLQSPRTTPLRVQFVITSLPVGGAEMLLLNLIRKMDREAFEPEVLCLKEPGALGSQFASVVPVHANLLNSKWDLGVLPRLSKLFRVRQTDAVITIGAGDKMFWGRLAAKSAGVPVICSALHSTGWPDGVGRLNRMLTGITSAFIACANGHAEHLIQHERFPAERVMMIPNGVDTDRFRPNHKMRSWLRSQLDVPKSSPIVGIVAALRHEKNHDQFVAAAREVVGHHPKAHFVIVGEGPERSNIEESIKQSGLTSHVHLLGSRSDTENILAGLDVFCLTSRNEANPVSILEALSCGVPVVSPDVGSVSETVIQGKTGCLTTPLCSASTTDALVQLLGNPGLAKRLGHAGRELVRKKWSLETMVVGYEHMISALYNVESRRTGKPIWQHPQTPHIRSDENDENQVLACLASTSTLVGETCEQN